jgi:hypothetical protein
MQHSVATGNRSLRVGTGCGGGLWHMETETRRDIVQDYLSILDFSDSGS